MFSKRVLSLALALLASAALAGPCFAGSLFDFQYSLSTMFGESQVSAQGTLEANDLGGGAYLIVGINGTRNVNGVMENITGAVPPGGFAGNSNKLYFVQFMPYLDFDGLSYTISNNGTPGYVNVYFDFNDYVYREASSSELGNAAAYGNFQVSPADAATPEPATAWLLFGGSAALFGWAGRRRRK